MFCGSDTESLTESRSFMAIQQPPSLSLFKHLEAALGTLIQPVRCSKATLVHLSHTLEDLVLSKRLPALVFTGFQESAYWRQETERYRALADVAQQVCIFAGKPLPPESSANTLHVALSGDDPLRQEWFLVILSTQFSVLLCGQDRQVAGIEEPLRQFDTLWSFEPALVNRALDVVEDAIAFYRPEKLAALQAARRAYPPVTPDAALFTSFVTEMLRFEENLHQRVNTLYLELGKQASDLERAYKELESFNYSVSHDLRAPLRAMEGFSRIVLKDFAPLLPTEAQRYLTLVNRNAEQMSHLIDELLRFSRLSRQPLIRRPTNPQELVRLALLDLQTYTAGRDIEFQVAAMPECLCDPTLYKQVYVNLLSNAIKFTALRPRAKIQIGWQQENAEQVYFVRDNGVGFDMKYAGKLFGVFQRLHNSSEYEGSGVGLAIVQRIVQRHGGRVWAQAEPGQGATFYFTTGIVEDE